VTVQSQTGSPCPDLPVYAFSGESYTGFHGTTDENGETVFTLPQGDYRFRADYDGVQFWSSEADHCTIPGCLEALVEIPSGVGEVNVTIDYTYDPLNRLSAADYSTGEYFHYSYDAVGNRLTQMTHESSSAYTYDIANRLIEVDGTAFIWDDNGNLIQDDRRIYHYDHANRLDFVSMEGESYSYSYNGLGDRLAQVAGGEFIHYSLDLAAGLTQVLDDGTNTYLYGVKRVGEEQPGGWQFHLGDALGSVRQLADVSEAVTLAQSYEPYGSVMNSAGSASIVFQFTGEQIDMSGLVYLRARFYEPMLGQFVSRDLVPSDDLIPRSHNGWVYVNNNPIVFRDPWGTRLCEDPWGDCIDIPLDPAVYVPPPDVSGSRPGDYVGSITDMVFGEGGSGSYRAAANIIQTIHNRAFNAWNSNRRGVNLYRLPWSTIRQPAFEKLVVFIAGESGTGGGGTIPAYNAWGIPQNLGSEGTDSKTRWEKIKAGVVHWLSNGAGTFPDKAPIWVNDIPPANPIRNPSVMWYFSFSKATEGFDYIWKDECVGGRVQYYFTTWQWGEFTKWRSAN
jgi:RHS repeat-associated protein